LYAGKLNTSGYVNSTTDPLAARFGSITTIDYDPKTLSLYVTDMGNNVFRRVTIVAPAVADFTADKTSVSANQVVTFTSSSSNANTLAWNITPGTYTLVNGSTLSSNKIYVTFQNVGSYTAELTATNGSGSNKKTRTNYINVSLIGSNKPAPDFYADKTSATVSDVVSFIDQTGDNPQSFAWTFTPNTVTFQNGTTASDRFPKVKFDAAGKYTVQLVATNTNGSNTKSKTDYVTVTTAGLENVAPANITLYPNPAANILHIDGEYHLFQIVATNGKIATVTADNGQINISDLTDGIYSIYAINKEGKAVTGRFIKLGN
jgi:PKD repeat protein